MIGLFLYTLLAWAANASFVFLLHHSLQEGQWLDILLGWQKRVFDWDLQGKQFMAKAIGGNCELCFSHIYTQGLFLPYAFFGVYFFDLNISGSEWYITLLMWWVWYFIYISVGTNISLNYLKYMHRDD